MSPRILLLADYFLPGYHGGGPVTSIRNLLKALEDECTITILTRDRDLGRDHSYPVEDRQRVRAEYGDVQYLPPGLRGMLRMRRILLEGEYDLLHLNSLFSLGYAIWPLLTHQLSALDVPVILAPRGQLSPGSLSLKQAKKHAYLSLARKLRLYDQVVWQASTTEEATEVRQYFDVSSPIRICPNIPHAWPSAEVHEKPRQRLKLLFLSRVARNKNLKFVLEVLTQFEKPATLSIVGPIEDEEYWRECLSFLEALPDLIHVSIEGAVPPARVREVYQAHDLLFLPTLGENYGHVIVEALSAGCPVLISDRTPWTRLEQHGIGWELPLDNLQGFLRVLGRVHSMPPDEYRKMAAAARDWAKQHLDRAGAIQAQREIFELALSRDAS